MHFYLISLLLSLFFAYMYVKDEKHQKIYFFLSSLPFILVSGFRYNVGTDYTYRYLPEFYEISCGGNPNNLEIGFKLIIRCILLFTSNSQYLFLITSILNVLTIYYFMFKYTKYPWICILVFFFGGFFFNSMNILRQYLAMSLLICAFHCLIDGKLYLWFMFIILAIFQHSVSIIFLLSFVPYYFKYDLRKIFQIFLSGLIFGIISKPLLLWLLNLTRFKVYITGSFASYVKGDFQIIQTIICLLIFIVYLFVYCKVPKIKKDKYFKFCVSMQFIALIFSLYTAFVFLSARFVVFFSIFSIYGIAKMYEYLENRKLMKRITMILMIVYVSSFGYLYLKNNVDEVLPYRFRLLEYQICIE